MIRKGDMIGPSADVFDPAIDGSGLDRELVIWVDQVCGFVALMHIDRDYYPHLTPLAGIIAAVECRELLLEDASRIRPQWMDRELSAKDRERRDIRMAAIRPIVDATPDVFDPVKRGRLIGQRAAEDSLSRNSLKKQVHNYYRFGQCANALLDRFDLCAVRRKGLVMPGWQVLGRQPDAGRGRRRHENGDIERQLEFEEAVKRERAVAGEAFSIDGAYRRWKDEFNYDFTEVDGRQVAALKPRYGPVEPVGYEQFRRWYHAQGQARATAIHILSEPIYDKDNRAITSSSTVETSGPGSRFQIDASVVNHSLASDRDRHIAVGRPYIYFVRCVWSRYIVGYYLGFQPPSMIAACLALMNAFMKKDDLLRRFGFDPEKDPWLANHVPGALTHDGGEITSHQGDWLVADLSTSFEQTASDRGDLKGAVRNSLSLV